MKAIAVDDEALALSVIDIFARKNPLLELVAQFATGREMLKYLDNNEVDLIFLDINMPHLSGVEVARLVEGRAMVIFTTAYQDYAVEGFELEAIDYLMKPFSYERFCKAVERAHEMKKLRGNSKEPQSVGSGAHIMIKSDSALVKVEVSSIIVIEGLKDYVKILTTSKRYVTKSTIKSMEQNLSSFGFVRVQKSYIVNMERVVSYEADTLTMEGDIMVPIGQQYKNSFVEQFKSHSSLTK